MTTDYPTAELVKVAANSFLATKISFINAMAEVCEKVDADVVALADAIGHDARIGRRFLNAGLGFGGGCLPKDIRAFMARAGELGADQALTFLREVDDINMRRRHRMVELTREVCEGSLLGRAGRGARRGVQARQRRRPRLPRAQRGRPAGACRAPTSRSTTPRRWTTPAGCGPTCASARASPRRSRAPTPSSCSPSGTSSVALDPEETGRAVRNRRILDGRNALDPAAWRAAGWTYRALGRPAA